MSSGIEFLQSLKKKQLKRNRKLRLSDWCDQNRVLSGEESSISGRWKTSFTPYLKEILDNLSPFSNVKKIYVMKSAQVGLTEAGLNWILYIIAQEPTKVWYCLPTEKAIKSASKLRFEQALRQHPKVQAKILSQGSAKEVSQQRLKVFEGGSLQFISTQVAKNLRSEAIKYIFCDEIDEYSLDLELQGSPIELLLQRQTSFSDSKLFAVSTPTIKGRSLIEENYNSSDDQRAFMLPCPYCQFYHEWKREIFDMRNEVMKCPKCNREYGEKYKLEMMKQGKWVSLREEPLAPEQITSVGYRLNSFYSPVGFVSWNDMSKKYNACKKDQNKLKTFTNTMLGETWSMQGAQLNEYELLARAEKNEYDPLRNLPHQIQIISAGVDIQADRIELEILGHGHNQETWSLDYRVFTGSTLLPSNEIFNHVRSYLKGLSYTKRVVGERDKKFSVSYVAIDSNYRSTTIAQFALTLGRTGVFCIRGRAYSRSTNDKPYTKMKKGWNHYTLDVDYYKEQVFSLLQVEQYGDGYCHFSLPHNNKFYFEMLTAEEKQEATNQKGFKFEKTKDRNEALDCRVYAMAALDMARVSDRYQSLTTNQEREERHALKVNSVQKT